MSNELYTVRSALGGYRVIKFDFLLNVECVYNVTHNGRCDCFQHNKPKCRHRTIVNLFVHTGRVNKGFFYCYDTEEWQLPVTERFKQAAKIRL